MSMSICLHLPVFILLVDSDWLISIKVGQSLTGNRNYFYLRQSWSNFDQVHQSGVYTVKVSKSKSIKVTWSNFDQVNFDSVNRLSCMWHSVKDMPYKARNTEQNDLFHHHNLPATVWWYQQFGYKSHNSRYKWHNSAMLEPREYSLPEMDRKLFTFFPQMHWEVW